MQAAHIQHRIHHPDIMVLPDRFDSASAPEIERDVRNFILSGVRSLALDASHTSYMTAAGMHALLSAAKAMQAVQGKLTVLNLEGQPKAIYEACAFDQMIPSTSQQDEAVVKMAA